MPQPPWREGGGGFTRSGGWCDKLSVEPPKLLRPTPAWESGGALSRGQLAPVARVVEDHRTACSTDVQVDHPATVDTDTTEPTSQRLVDRDQLRGDVNCTASEMLAPSSPRENPLAGLRPLPRQDGQRPADSMAEVLKSPYKLLRRAIARRSSIDSELG